MSYNPDNNSLEAKRKRKQLEVREKILKRHEEGTLPRSYYKTDRKTGKPYISPKKIAEEENLIGL